MIAGWLEAILKGMYDRLAVGQPTRPADLIFVLAGRPERKRYGWELFQHGVAPVLLLSVGRSEARFLRVRAGLPEDGNIVALLPIRPEQGNHIFFWAEEGRVRPEVVRLPERNTFGEIWALANVIQQRDFHDILVVSASMHLRRIRFAVRQLFGATPIRITYLGVPKVVSACCKHQRWRGGQDTWRVITEWNKLAGYHLKYGVFRWHYRYARDQLAEHRNAS